MPHARLLEGRRHRPDLARLPGERCGDLLEGREPRRVDAVVIGYENAHVAGVLCRLCGAAPSLPVAPGGNKRAGAVRGARGAVGEARNKARSAAAPSTGRPPGLRDYPCQAAIN